MPAEPADAQRGERFVLREFGPSRPRQFERRDEAGGERRPPQFGPGMGREEIVQLDPVERYPQHGRYPVERAFQRHDRAVRHMVDARSGARLDPAIGLDQRVGIAGPHGAAIGSEALGRSALEHVAPDPVARQQLRRRFAHRAQTLQPQLQPGGQFVRIGFLAFVARQQQRRFEVGEPGGHHEVIGRQFEPEILRLFDMGEVLVDERQDRNLAQVDLLPPREVQQQIERTFPAIEFEIQRLRLAPGCRFIG